MIYRHQIHTILDYVDQNGLNETTLEELRKNYPGCHFTYCMDDDVSFSKAYVEKKDFNLYLVDSRDHCSTLTSDPEVASGIVLAEVADQVID